MPRAPKRPWTLAAVTIVVWLGLDRVAKWWAVESLMGLAPREYLGGSVRIEYAENTGAFLGMGSTLPDWARLWLLEIGTAVILLYVAVLMVRSRHLAWPMTFILASILAGGLGNLVDRVAQGYVVDFVSMGIGGLRTGIFNIADVGITGGVIGLLFAGRLWAQPEEAASSDTPDAEPPPSAEADAGGEEEPASG